MRGGLFFEKQTQNARQCLAVIVVKP
ncbi:MAG: hypothetical protein RL757_521, partial [Bacteroidota bacterium]